jgi:hypothetical protein
MPVPLIRDGVLLPPCLFDGPCFPEERVMGHVSGHVGAYASLSRLAVAS